MLFQKGVHNLMLTDERTDCVENLKLSEGEANISNVFKLKGMPQASLGKQLPLVLLFTINMVALCYIPLLDFIIWGFVSLFSELK